MHKLLPASLALALATPFGASADTASDIQSLRQEFRSLRADYEARIKSLEERLRAAESAGQAGGAAPSRATTAAAARAAATAPNSSASATIASNSAPAASSPALASTAPASPPPSVAAETAPTAAGAGNSFNPAMSLILSGLYTRTSRDPSRYAISGVQLPPNAEIGPGTRGFSLAESELGFAANIDPWWRGAAHIALHPDDSVSVEEAYVQTSALGNGLTLKAGRFFSGVGYLNAQHSHTWDFVDNPLAYQAFLGTQFGDDGAQLLWLAPTDQYIELGAEVGRGRSFPGSDSSRNGAGMSALTLHTGGDVGESHSWRAGLSMLDAKATDQSLQATSAGGNDIVNRFNGSTRVWVADAVWKWAPNGNATRTNFKLQGELLHSVRRGTLAVDVDGANTTGTYRAAQSGWYVQGVYQFIPHWRVGLRTERIDPGTPELGDNAGSVLADGFRPHKNTLMVDFSPSEFSRVRLQWAQDRARAGPSDNQLFLQYQMSLGAHGAHSY